MVRIRLKELRGPLSQWEVAKAVDCHPKTVALWEAGATLPRPETLEKLATLFKVSVGDLFEQTA